jgi:predicted ATP-grasp superfamily ATP-dependent carboligase
VKNKKIGLVGQHGDPGVELLKRRVEDLGAVATIVDFRPFPNFAKTFLKTGTLVYDGIDLTSMDAFYLRQLGYFSPLPQQELSKEEWVGYYEKFNDYMTNEREVMSFKESVIQILCDLKPVINPYRTAFYHKLKANQYWKLASEGLPVPEFIAGNEFFEMRGFVAATRSVIKPMVSGFVNAYTASDLDRDRETLRKRPVILQRQIPGRMLRSFVLGDGVIGTCEIVHEKSDADSRRNIVAMRAFALDRDQELIPVKACQALGMIFAGVDLILEERSGELYVLECNPAPLFRNFEAQTGVPVSQELAAYLVEEAVR